MLQKLYYYKINFLVPDRNVIIFTSSVKISEQYPEYYA